ncbi:ATP-dependent RNA helicase [Haplosporangium sp. Z 27]|nr:ATP-dependent RNA helicase [Haplosporangium sp. Z 27]
MDTQLKLWCFVEGESKVFSAIIDSNKTVEDLQTAIQPKKSSLKDVFSSDLTLWKAEISTVRGHKREAVEELDNPGPSKCLRTFANANANAVFPESNFYIRPHILDLVGKSILSGSYTIFCGHRQSGKSSVLQASLRWFREHREHFMLIDKEIYPDVNKDEYIPRHGLYYGYEIHIITFDTSIVVNGTIDEFWETKNLDKPRPVILLIDEASRLASADNSKNGVQGVISSFTSTLKALRDDRETYCIYSVGLYGTESVKDLIAHESPSHPPSISPFSYSECWNCGRFDENDVTSLLAQFTVNKIMEIDTAGIASDIYALTLGHRETQRSMFGTVLRFGVNQVSPDDDDLKFLLAEGLVIEAARGLTRALNPEGPPEDAPDRDRFDPKWLLTHTIKYLCLRHLYAGQAMNFSTGEPFEYAFQAEFSTIIKSFLSATYPEKGYKTLVEVKEYDENGNRSQRLDILVRNGGPAACGYELVVAPTLSCFREHVTRAQYYAAVHNTDNMFVVNLYPKPNVEYFQETPDKSAGSSEDSGATTSMRKSSRLADKDQLDYKESLQQPLEPFEFPLL